LPPTSSTEREAHPGRPALITDPALICYCLFYPGHDEGLQGCAGVNEAKEFGSFAGEWTCIALLLDRPDANAPYTPKFVGLTNRNIGKIQVAGREERITMRIRPWTAMKLFGNTHPGFEVGKGTASTGGNGGLYGAGGGGGGYVTTGVGSQGGKGADGLIVITYTP
jgi:hypothetical protein